MHLTKTILAISLLSFTPDNARAQQAQPAPPSRLNTAYLELGGPLGFYSLNYERRIPIAKKWGIGVSAGILPSIPKAWSDAEWGFNGAVKAVYQQGKNRFTAGTGYSHFFMASYNSYGGERSTYNDNYIFAQFGYNRVMNRGFTYGAYWTPLASLQWENYIFHWPAVQLGYAF